MPAASNRSIAIACAGFAAGACAVALFGFGPLDPPDGPISPTFKTLSEVEPRIAINATNTPGDADSKFKITKPGSYYVNGNLTGVSGKSGIEVVANCTIDLCGFQLTGVNGSLDGILLVGGFQGTIRNGQIVTWGGNGIAGVDCNGCLFEDLSVAGNGGAGIWVGRNSVLDGVRSLANQTYGIRVDRFCTIVDCTASENAYRGMLAGTFGTVSRCNASGNIQDGMYAYPGTNISDCVSASNGRYGIITEGGLIRDSVCDGNPEANIFITGAGGAIVRNNTCSNSAGSGIYCQGRHNHVEANLLRSNDCGITLALNGSNFVVRNVFAVNSTYYSDSGGNNMSKILYDPGFLFTSENAWANLAGND